MKYILLLLAFASFNIKMQPSLIQEKKDIIVYGSDTCHYCIDTKEFLDENQIKFVYYDIDQNIKKQAEMIEKLKKANIPLSNLSLPVIDKDGVIFTNNQDFDKFLLRIKEN